MSNDNNSLFDVQPTISPTGTLTYTPAPNANGLANVTVLLRDDGGTANGGKDTSLPQTFVINVTPVDEVPVNDPPSFLKGANQSVWEDAGARRSPAGRPRFLLVRPMKRINWSTSS